MECERLVKLVKSWYLQVKDEALAPARMVVFMEKHVAECPVCMVDDGVRQEIDRITRIVLPPSKMPKPKTADDEEEDEPVAEEEESTDDTDEESEEVEDGEDDEDKEDLGEEDEDFEEDDE